MSADPDSYQVCTHCRQQLARNVDILFEHTKICKFAKRPNEFRFRHVCYRCAYFTHISGTMKMHIREHLGDRPHKCDFCSYSSSRRSNLKLHLKKHVKDPDLLPNIYSSALCEYCNSSFSSNRDLMEHWEQCSLVPLSSVKTCLYCNKFVPSDIDVFIGHCQTCPRMAHLNNPIPQSCKHCNKFTSIHIQEIIDHSQSCEAMGRPDPLKYKFVCVACDYYTIVMQNLRNHSLIHMGDKQFRCCLCAYGGYKKEKLQIHVKRKHSTKVK